MEFILVFLALILATFFGWLLKQSFNTQPWVAEVVDDNAHQAPMGANAKFVALVVLLAVVTSFFGLIMSAYSERMELPDWVPMTEPVLLWINTGILVAASIVFQWTRNLAVNEGEPNLMPGMLLTGVLTGSFVVGQMLAWQQLSAAGQTVTANPSTGFFYFLTGAHALHMLGGMYVWARATVRLATGKRAETVQQSVELCAVYWHYLLLVWLLLFGLLLST